ncbi:sensor histidine kinase [Candidatus Colwellia aromaticivorans]|uniref:sensor histidine kinase n=1 Tax=Candidatus Colwellia aromaticivorans TaxID=2267621 RepID=UPI000DF1284F|nr:HAMP domain-containing sensor histidine kinase [Candidatus Colwellia aromaticivorans]
MNSKLPEETIDTLPSPSPEQQAYIQHQSLMLLVSSLNKVIYVFPLTASILTVLFWPHTNHVILGSWLVAIYVLSLVRNTVHKTIRQQKSTTLNYSRWLKYMLMLDVITGALAGFSSVFLASLPQDFQWLLIIVIIAISMESVAGQSAIKSSFIAFSLPLFSGFSLGLILVGSNIFYILSILVLLHAFFLYGNFTAMHHHIKTNLTLTFSNQQLAKQLKQKNQALVTSNKQVNATSQAKSKFIISMSQELRVPLQGMLKLLESVQKNTYDPEHLRSLSIVRSSGVRLLNLLNDLVDVYRLEKGKLQPKVEVFEVRQHFEDLVHLLAINAHIKGLKIFCTIDSKVPAKIETDPVRLSQITLNLLTNALKFSDQGQVELKISSQMHGEQAFLNISVSDTGIGIDQDDMKMIFQPFIQGKSDAESLGNGLGLAISRELCQLLDGEMSAHSVAGKGSVFSFEIPVKVIKQSELPVLYNEKSILLVEGDNQHQISIEHQLRFLNLPYKTAINAKEAMATCAENRNKIAAVIIGHQSKLQQKLLINLCQRLKLQTIELLEFGKDNNSEGLTLNYPIKLEQLKIAINRFLHND